MIGQSRHGSLGRNPAIILIHQAADPFVALEALRSQGGGISPVSAQVCHHVILFKTFRKIVIGVQQQVSFRNYDFEIIMDAFDPIMTPLASAS